MSATPPPATQVAPCLLTSRLFAVPATPKDIEALVGLWRRPEVRRYLWDDTVVAEETARTMLQESERDFHEVGVGLWRVLDRETGTLAGFVGFRPVGEDDFELLYGFAGEWWGRGLATEAAVAAISLFLEVLDRPRILASTDDGNDASVRMLKRLGFLATQAPPGDSLHHFHLPLPADRSIRPAARVVVSAGTFALERLGTGDEDFLVALLNQRSFLHFIGDRGVREAADATRYIAEGPERSWRKHRFGLFKIVREGLPVGICGLVDRDGLDHPDIGFALLDDSAGHGIARAAAEAALTHARHALGIETVLAVTSLDNDRSIGLLGRLGFESRAETTLPGQSSPVRLFGIDLSKNAPR